MKIYLVGGAVRDEFLGLPIKERDYVVIGATPEQMTAQGYLPVGRDFPVFLHPKTHEEYALARTERKTARGHQGFQFYTDPNITLEEDLKRRDLTINAMAKEPDTGRIIDPYQGALDLQKRLLRHVSEAFSEDPLRILRIARFAAYLGKFDFKIAQETFVLMQKMVKAHMLQELSHERIWMELFKVLQTDYPEKFFEVLESIGALAVFWQGLPTLKLKETTNPLIRFAILSYKARYLFPAPKEYEELAHLVHEKANLILNFESFTAEEKVTLLRSLDYLRRPERLILFLEACRLLNSETPVRDIETAVQKLQNLNRKAVSTQAHPQNIAKAIFEAECEALR